MPNEFQLILTKRIHDLRVREEVKMIMGDPYPKTKMIGITDLVTKRN